MTASIPHALDVTVIVHHSDPPHRLSNRENLTCFRCGAQGHYKSECSTWRTRMCAGWKRGLCNDANCAFAHGAEQLRTPWRPMCVKVLRMEDGTIKRLGCLMYGHTISKCPYRCMPIEPDAP